MTNVGVIQNVQRRITAKRSAADGSTLPTGSETADIVVGIDIEKLARLLGPKAMRSKQRKSVLQYGAITVQARNIRFTPDF